MIAVDETGLYSEPQRFVVTVSPDTTPPTVVLTATPDLLLPGESSLFERVRDRQP